MDAWLLDTGYQTSQVLTPEQMAQARGTPAREVVRLEAVADRVAGEHPGAGDFASRFAEALAAAVKDAVGLKSIAAYRYGLDFDPARPTMAEVSEAAGHWLRAVDGGAAPRVTDPVLLRYLIWTGVDTGLPLQFHVGFGDPDVRLHRADPSLLHDFLLATQDCGTAIMLLHCYPYHRQAACLANVFPHVYLDVGEALNHVGASSAAVLAEALEVAPFHKQLYSSDAFGLPELHYLGAVGFRRDIARVTGDFVADGAWSVARTPGPGGRPGPGRRTPAGYTGWPRRERREPWRIGACARHWPASSTRRSGSAATCTRTPSCPDPSTARRPRCRRRSAPPTRPRSGARGGSCASGRSPARAWRSGPSWMPCAVKPRQTGVPWASQNGAMHACGHDVHLAALTALARAARGMELPAGLLAVLQPREEASPLGAPDIVASAAFAAQQPRAVVGVHLQHQLPPGTVAAAAGTVNAAADEFEITVEGTGGHAGYPQLAADPVPALCQAVLALQQIVSRRTDPTHAVVVLGRRARGGPGAERHPGHRHRPRLAARAGRGRPCGDAQGDARDRGAYLPGPRLPRHRDDRGGRACAGQRRGAGHAASWPRLREAGFTVDTSFRSCGADDFAYYARSAPALMLFVGTGGPVSLHHPRFLPDDGTVGQVAAVMLAGYLGAVTLIAAGTATTR